MGIFLAKEQFGPELTVEELKGCFLDYLSQIADARLSPQEVRQINMIHYLGYMSAEFT